MSRRSQKPINGIKLPFALQQELGIESPAHRGGRRAHGSVRGRKEQRKAERQGKRAAGRGSRHAPRQAVEEDSDEAENPWGTEDDEEEEEEPITPAPLPKVTKRPTSAGEQAQQPKSILKRPKQCPQSLDRSSTSRSRSSSPGLVLDASSKAFQDRAAQDDAEISTLERRLGMKKRKRSAVEDGLDDILGGLGDEEEDVNLTRKHEEREWLERKRRKATGDEAEIETDDDLELDDQEDEGDGDSDLDTADEDEDEDSEEDVDEEGGFSGFDLDRESEPEPAKRVRENPYVAPPTANTPPTKYIPPSLRRAQGSEAQSTERLKRQVQGHLNKLSEANLISILGETEKIYQSNPRQDVTTVLIDLLLTLFCNKSSLQNTFVILHAAFSAAIYKVIGLDFGADLVSQLVDRFDEHHSSANSGKEALNLISLLSNLFTFHVISSTIIFDHIRILLSDLTESNTELLLRLIRDCGPQLRQDDPSSLKSIVQLMQKEASRITNDGEHMSVRTRFMIETITDLKNNKMKNATSNAGLSSEHITQMRKTLGSLNNRPSLRATEPLRISRDDIKNSDRKGKWWLVGASWKGNLDATTADPTIPTDDFAVSVTAQEDSKDPNHIDLGALARAYGMNTSVRRSIFITLLSSVDAVDAHTRLLKLRLKRSQEHEIPHVLLRCSAGEDPYNPYYALVAKRVCTQRRTKKAFEFALWGWWRTRLGEKMDAGDDGSDLEDDTGPDDAGEGGSNAVKMTEIANLSRLYASLILDGSQSLGILRVLDLAYIKERTSMFVELLLVLIFTEASSKAKSGAPADVAIGRAFENAAVEAPQIVKRLQFFLKNNVKHSDLVEKKNRGAVKRGCLVASQVLKRAGAGSFGLDDADGDPGHEID